MTAGVATWSASPGMSNLTAIVDGGAVLVVDAGAYPSMARAFLAAQGFDHVDRCVLTHHHADHTLGLAGLGAGEVLATNVAAALLAQRGDSERTNLAQALAASADEVLAAPAPVVTRGIADRETLAVGSRAVQLIPVGHAHTPGDLLVFEPDTGTLITGDLVFTGIVPVLRDADIDGWIAALQLIVGLGATTIVPGHGMPGPRASLDDALDLLTTMRALVADRPDVDSIALPSRFSALARQDRVAPALRAIRDHVHHDAIAISEGVHP